MVDYREIINLKSLKFSNLAIANILYCSRNTVSDVLALAETHSLEWPIPDSLTNSDIEHLFYPDRSTNEGRKLPDYEYIYNKLAKPGVTLSLLWAEYCTQCEAEHTIPYSPHSSMTSTILMLHQRKQHLESSVNPEKPWKWTRLAIRLRFMMLPAAVISLLTYL